MSDYNQTRDAAGNITSRFDKMVKDFMYTDFVDALFVLKLKQEMEWSFEELEILDAKDPIPDYFWTTYADHIRMIRSCIFILQWYEGTSFNEELKRVNKHSLKLEEVF